MSYDGGLIVVIKNKELGRVLKKHFDEDLFDNPPWICENVKCVYDGGNNYDYYDDEDDDFFEDDEDFFDFDEDEEEFSDLDDDEDDDDEFFDFDDDDDDFDDIGKQYIDTVVDFYYNLTDFAEIEDCPRTLSGVLYCLTELMDRSCGNSIDDTGCSLTKEMYLAFKKDLAAKREAIENSYEYVRWEYLRPDSCGGGMETYVFNGEQERFKADGEEADAEADAEVSVSPSAYRAVKIESEKKTVVDYLSDDAKSFYEECLIYTDFDAEIVFEDRVFVFNNENAAVKALVAERGGIVRSTVSSKTDYLVVDCYFGSRGARFDRALKEKQGGSGIRILSLRDLLHTLAGRSYVPLQQDDKKFHIIDGVLWAYRGYEEEIVIPDGVWFIAPNVFKRDHSISYMDYEDSCAYQIAVTMPDSVLGFSNGAFEREILKELDLSENLLYFVNYALSGQRLTHIAIPPRVTELPNSLLESCDWLTAVAIPPSVNVIAHNSLSRSPLAFYRNGDKNLPITVYGERGSTAEDFAAEQGYRFAPLSEYGKADADLCKGNLSAESSVICDIASKAAATPMENVAVPKEKPADLLSAPLCYLYDDEKSYFKAYRKHFDVNESIVFEGKSFVFASYNATLAEMVEERGGSVKKSVSSKTDYYVVDFYKEYSAKQGQRAVEEKQKGNPIKIVSFGNLIHCLLDLPFPTLYRDDEEFHIIDGVLWEYRGNLKAKEIVIPDGVWLLERSALGEHTYGRSFAVTMPDSVLCFQRNTFMSHNVTELRLSKNLVYLSCLSSLGIARIKLPSGIREISNGVLWNNNNLCDILIPPSVTEIAQDAIINLYDPDSRKASSITIYGEKGSAAEAHAKDLGFMFCSLAEYPAMDVAEERVAEEDDDVSLLDFSEFSDGFDFGDEDEDDDSVALLDFSSFFSEEDTSDGLGEDIDFDLNLDDDLDSELDLDLDIDIGDDDDLNSDLGLNISVEFSIDLSEDTEDDDLEDPDLDWLDEADEDDEFDICGTELRDYLGYDDVVVIPRGIKTIASNAFQGKNVEKVVIPEGVVSIDDFAFEGCLFLKDLSLPSTLRTIGEWAFSGCTGLESVTIPGGVREMGRYAFSECTFLEKVVISKGLKTIGDSAFWSCTFLKKVQLPEGLETIEGDAFLSCESLNTITIPDSVTYIYYGAIPEETTIRASKDSYAREYAKENGNKFRAK